MKALAANSLATLSLLAAKILTAVRAEWRGFVPQDQPCVYYANHASHGDFILISAVLPPDIRQSTRPVAGADYWLKGPLRAFLGRSVFRAVLITRQDGSRGAKKSEAQEALDTMIAALDEGSSLIVFPEGTRNLTDERLLSFKSGLYRLAAARPDVRFVPVWINNLNRVLPKGEAFPVPLLCSVVFGAPINLDDNENRQSFLTRSREALLALADDVDPDVDLSDKTDKARTD